MVVPYYYYKGGKLKENWKKLKPSIEYNEFDSITDKLLKIRGLYEDKDTFLNPSLSNISSPWELSNMSDAVDRIVDAIKCNLRIGIYADCDTDGVTSLAIMYKYLLNFDVSPIVLYHQRDKGHSMIVENIPKDLDLLIVVDSSTNDVKECKDLSDNMEIIILDHHPSTVLNPFAIIVNPQCNDYKNKALSGAGVVYQTCRAIDDQLKTSFADNYLDLCAVGMLGDMMEVTSPESRAIMHFGLLKIQKDCDNSLKFILKFLKKENKPDSTSISFYVVPFINSIIRLGKIENIIDILISNDEKTIKGLLKICGGMNEERKDLQARIVNQIESNIDLSNKIIILDVSDFDVKTTLNGLVANNIAQKYQKPTLIVSMDNETNTLKGSGRNYGNDFDLKTLLLNSKLFSIVAGHESAFGVEFLKSDTENIYKYVNSELENISQDYIIEYDIQIDSKDIRWDILNDIQKLSFVTGQGFPNPLFVVENLSVDNFKIMKDIHVKFTSDDLDCVKFNISEEEVNEISESMFVDVVGSLGINAWYNFGTRKMITNKQILIKDAKTY